MKHEFLVWTCEMCGKQRYSQRIPERHWCYDCRELHFHQEEARNEKKAYVETTVQEIVQQLRVKDAQEEHRAQPDERRDTPLEN